MSDTNLIKHAWCSDVPVFEQALFPVVFPVMRLIARQKFNLTPEAVEQAKEQIKSIFVRVSEMLADGRVYLVGDGLSAADITFAALAAPALAPPEHPKKRDNLQELPPQMVAQIQEFRQTPAGAFALRLYSEREMPATRSRQC
jgi:glutathione S-transferase